jgi:hypothetical protein
MEHKADIYIRKFCEENEQVNSIVIVFIGQIREGLISEET